MVENDYQVHVFGTLPKKKISGLVSIVNKLHTNLQHTMKMITCLTELIVAFLCFFCCISIDLFYPSGPKDLSVAKSKAPDIYCTNTDICNIIVTGKNGLAYGTIHCPRNEDCNIVVMGMHGLAHGAIHCPSNEDCNIECNASHSCYNVTVFGQTRGNNSLKIGCNHQYACANAKINSFDNINGTLTVYSNYVSAQQTNQLYNSHTVCPLNGECTIYTSSGVSLCSNNIIVNATYSRSLDITLYPFAYGVIYCPNPDSANQTIIGNKKNCNVSLLTNRFGQKSTYNQVLRDTKFYAVESFNNLEINCLGKACDSTMANGRIYDPKLICKSDYSANCTLSWENDKFQCHRPSHCNWWTIEKENNEKNINTCDSPIDQCSTDDRIMKN